MMTFAIIIFAGIIFGQHVIATKNYNLLLPALLFSVVIILLFSTFSGEKKNHSHSSTAGVNITLPKTNSVKTTAVDEVDSAIPDPIQSGYDIPLM
jgi:hypothetical protein